MKLADCPTCGSEIGTPCKFKGKTKPLAGGFKNHHDRMVSAQRAVGLGVKKKRPNHQPKKSHKTGFYNSWEWKRVRFESLALHGRQCMCCGWSPSPGDKRYLCVDHIKPRSKFPALALDVQNTQVLCNDCNRGKSNIYHDDFREGWHGDEPEEQDDPLTAQFRATMQ